MEKNVSIQGVIRWPALKKLFNDDISRSTIDRWIKAGNFPKKISLGINSVGWSISEIDLWFQEKVNSTKGVI